MYIHKHMHTYIHVYLSEAAGRGSVCKGERDKNRNAQNTQISTSISKAPKGNGIGASGSKNPRAY